MILDITDKTGQFVSVGFDSNLNPIPVFKVDGFIKKIKLRDKAIVISEDDNGQLVVMRFYNGSLWQDNNDVDGAVKTILDKYEATRLSDLTIVYDDYLNATTFNGLAEKSLKKITATVNLFSAVGYVKAYNLGFKCKHVRFDKMPLKWVQAKALEEVPMYLNDEDSYYICWTHPHHAKIYNKLEKIPLGVYKVAVVTETQQFASWVLYCDKTKFDSLVEGGYETVY